jgi:pimeloyl-ACP methyl ester carboxylesterase
MTRPSLPSLCVVLCLIAIPGSLPGQDAGDRQPVLEQRLKELNAALDEIDAGWPGAVDAQVCAKGVDWILRHEEFYKPNYVQETERALEMGFQRVNTLQQGEPDWGRSPGRSVLAYRSRVDESVQPYAVTLPAGYDPDEGKRWPLYVVLHGRNAGLNEVRFLAQHEGKPPEEGQFWIQLDVFGRTNNAYRWAGETDVFEALADVQRRYRIDDRRISLWGFSMGGAGAWHLALHHPSRWASAGGGAGFVDFYAYQKRAERLPEHQHRLLSIYDATNYALNLSLVPFITYGGENDPQLLASTTMKALADELDLPLTMLVGPGMGHKFDEQSLKAFMEFLAEHNRTGRPPFPGRREFDFVTYTLKYNTCEWLTIEEQEIPYERTLVSSTVDDDGDLNLVTSNVAALSAARGAADRIRIDESGPFDLNTAADGNLPEVYFVNEGETWRLLDYDESIEFLENPDPFSPAPGSGEESRLRKRHNLQGPIDDAFMEPFVCVTGGGTPWSREQEGYARWSLERFEGEFDKFLRGRVPVRDEGELTEAEIAEKHLVLFGDPGSNGLLSRIAGQLPCEWNAETITFRGETYSTRDHALVLVYPNPLNPRKYVVVNTGMTMRERDFKSSNAWLFPKWGDYAVIRFEKTDDGGYREEVVAAGIFDATWNP